MSGDFVSKAIVDRDRIRDNTQKTVQLLRYTGDDLEKRDMRKFIEVIYRNFEQLNDVPELKHTYREIARILTSAKSIIIIAMIGDRMIGYLLAEVTTVDNLRQLMHIYYLFVSPMYRKRGVATYMLNLIEKYAQELNINTLSLTFDTYDKKLEEFYLNNYFMYDSNLRSYQRYDMLVKFV